MRGAMIGVVVVIMHVITGVASAQQSIPAGAEIVDMKRVPVESLFRVTRADGQVFYISGDRRWLFHGKLMDMWTGEHEKDMVVHDVMSWERAGFSPAEVSLGSREEDMEGVLFVARECDACLKVIDEARTRDANVGIATIPPNDRQGEAATREIWCKKGDPLAIVMDWIQNSSPGSGIDCDRAAAVGKILAMVAVYGLNRQEPTFIEASGRIHRGKQKIMDAWRQK